MLMKTALTTYLYSDMKKVAKQAGAVATVTLFGVFTRLIAFLFKIYLSRVLGAEALGLYQIALSVFLLFASLSSTGIPMVVGRRVAEADALGKKDDLSFFTTALIYSFSLSFFIVMILILCGQNLSFLFSEPLACPLFLIMVPALLSTSVYCVVRGWFWGKKLFTAFSFTETLEETLRILFSAFFLSGAIGAVSGATAIAYAFTVSDIIVGVTLLALFFIKGGSLKKPAPLKEVLAPSMPITAMRVLAGAFATLVAMILPARLISSGFTPTEATEAFGRITGMANPLLFVPTTITGSIAVVLLPDVSALAVKKEYRTLNNRIDLGVNFSVLLCGLFMSIYFTLGEEITGFLYDDTLSGKYLSVAAISMLPMCLSQMTQSVLNSIGKEKQTFLTYLAGNIVMLVLIVILPRYIGVYAVAVASVASFGIDGIANSILLHQATGWGKNSVKYLVCCLLFSFLTTAFTRTFLPLSAHGDLFFVVFQNVFISCVVYIALCFVFGLVDADVVLRFYKNKGSKRKIRKNSSARV